MKWVKLFIYCKHFFEIWKNYFLKVVFGLRFWSLVFGFFSKVQMNFPAHIGSVINFEIIKFNLNNKAKDQKPLTKNHFFIYLQFSVWQVTIISR